MRPANFDRVARFYRWAEYASLGPVLQRVRTHFLAQTSACRSALLLGDGDGRFAASLLQGNPEIHATAVDSSARMLDLLRARCSFAPARLNTVQTQLESFTPTGRPSDLVSTQFVLDCLSQADVDRLIARVAAAAATPCLWIVSDFGDFRSAALRPLGRAYVQALYAAFRLLTGLRVYRIPAHAPALAAAGFRPIARRERLGGLLFTELWERPAAKDYNLLQASAQRRARHKHPLCMSTEPSHDRPAGHLPSDALPDPEPAPPSLDEPDPGVFHHEPGTSAPQPSSRAQTPQASTSAQGPGTIA